MPVEEALTELTQRVKERLPSNIKITELEFAGPEVVSTLTILGRSQTTER